MSEDIFSQFFNLFNNDEEDVNWELAKQINNHLNKDDESFIPELSNQDIKFDEIFRVVELNSDKTLSETMNPVELKLLDSKDYGLWFLDSIKHFDFSNFELGGMPEGLGIKNIKYKCGRKSYKGVDQSLIHISRCRRRLRCRSRWSP